jgi:hypothetical protein
MKSYFSECTTFKEFKARFRELAKEFHPDYGGNAENFKAMSNEYQAKLDYFTRIDTRVEDILKYGASGTSRASSIEDEYELARRVDKLVNKLGLTVNISGEWIWIQRESVSRIAGDDVMRNFKIKTALLALGFTFSKKYDAYHWTAHYGTYEENNYTLSDLFNRFGNIQQSPEEIK